MSENIPESSVRIERNLPARRKRWLRGGSGLAVLALAAAVTMAARECPSLPENCSAYQVVSVGNYSLTYKDIGTQTNGPIVILLSGDGDNITVWRKTQPEIAKFTRVIAYDRGGVGCSDAAPNPRTAEVVAAELEAFLNALGITQPVLFCGHSMGGLYARFYINQHPEDAVGLVLIDATSEYLENDLAEVLSPDALDKQDIEYGLYFEFTSRDGSKGEYYNRYNSCDQVIANTNLPDIPLTYLSAGKYDPGEVPADQANAANGVKEALDELQVGLVPNGQLIVVPDTGHDIHIQQPQAVIDAVQSMFNEIVGP
jgi:pimeloyl-ACP methyl ester carboxylesterase